MSVSAPGCDQGTRASRFVPKYNTRKHEYIDAHTTNEDENNTDRESNIHSK